MADDRLTPHEATRQALDEMGEWLTMWRDHLASGILPTRSGIRVVRSMLDDIDRRVDKARPVLAAEPTL